MRGPSADFCRPGTPLGDSEQLALMGDLQPELADPAIDLGHFLHRNRCSPPSLLRLPSGGLEPVESLLFGLALSGCGLALLGRGPLGGLRLCCLPLRGPWIGCRRPAPGRLWLCGLWLCRLRFC